MAVAGHPVVCRGAAARLTNLSEIRIEASAVIREYASAFFSTVLLLLAAAGVGELFERFLPDSVVHLERRAVKLLGGIGLLGLALFLIGQIAWTRSIVWPLLLVPGIFQAIRLWRRPPSLGINPLGNMGIAVGVAMLLVYTLSAFAVPVGTMADDAISYHLLGPKVWLRDGKIHPILDSSHTAFPATVETLFAALMLLSNERAPALFGVAIAGLLLIQIWGITKHLGGDDAAAGLSVGIAATMPVIVGTADLSFVDIPYAALTLASARLAWTSRDGATAIAAGAYAGFAIGTKYTGLLMLPSVCLVLLFKGWTESRTLQQFKHILLAVGAAAVAGASWYLKNWIQLGTPIYPPPTALWDLWPARAFPREASASFQAFLLERGKGLGRGLPALLLLPYNLTYNTAAFHGAGGIGLAPLALVPPAIIRFARNPAARCWGLWCLMLTAAWFWTQQEARFLINVLAVSSAFAAVGSAVFLEQPGKLGRWLGWSVLWISFVYGAATALVQYERIPRIESVFSARVAQERWKNRVPYESAFALLNNSDEVQSVLILDSLVPPYYLNRPYLKVRGMLGEKPLDPIATPQEALLHLDRLNVTHVLDVNRPNSPFLISNTTKLKVVMSGEDARVYEVDGAK